MVMVAFGFSMRSRWFYADPHLPKTALVVGLVQNRTNDLQLNTFAGLLSSTLEKSRSLTVISQTEVQDYLIRHKKDPNAFSETIGRAVCRETEASLLLLPSVSRSDSDIVLQCRLQCIHSDSSWTFRKIISSRDSIYAATDLIADAIRLKARESQVDVRRNPSNTVQATSPNLEAYQFYNYGELELKKVKLVQARAYFQQAVELDSTFGQAYYQLANIALWMDDDPISSHTLFQAASRFNIPDRQQYLLKANMAAIEKGSHDGLQVLQTMGNRFQDEREVQYLLGSWFFDLGQYHKAIPILEKLLKKDPAFEMPYGRIIESYKQVHREDLAEKMRAEYARHNPNASLRLKAWEKFYSGDPEGARKIFMEDLNRDAISPDGLMGLVRTSYALKDSALLLDAVNRFGHAGYNRLWFELINSSLAAFGSSSLRQALYKNWFLKYKDKEQPLAISYAELLMYEDRYDKAEQVLKPWCTPEKLSSFRLLTLEQLLYVYLYQGRYIKAKELVQDMIQWCKANNLAAHQGRFLIMQRFLYDWSEQAPPGITALDAKIDSLAPSISSSVYWRPYYYYCLLKQEPAKAEKILSEHMPAWKLFSHRQIITEAWQGNGPQATAIDSLVHPHRPYHFDIKPIPVIVYYHLAKKAFLQEDWPAAERYARLVIGTYQNNFGLRAVFYHKALILLARMAERQGRIEEARRYYKKVLTLWARADDNLPDLQWLRQKINTIPGL
jgi:tetratricopeptide (TPR) repeat protein